MIHLLPKVKTGLIYITSLSSSADPRYDLSDKIDILLGAQVHASIIEQGLWKGDTVDTPIAMQTLLGWIISGATSHQSSNHRALLTANLQVDDIDLNGLLRKFWDIEV